MRIHHVQLMIPAGREDEARGYYQGLLGFRPLERPEDMPRPGLWFQAGPAELHLGFESGRLEPEARAHVAFAVPPAEFERLREAILGADFEVREAGGSVGSRTEGAGSRGGGPAGSGGGSGAGGPAGSGGGAGGGASAGATVRRFHTRDPFGNRLEFMEDLNSE